MCNSFGVKNVYNCQMTAWFWLTGIFYVKIFEQGRSLCPEEVFFLRSILFCFVQGIFYVKILKQQYSFSSCRGTRPQTVLVIKYFMLKYYAVVVSCQGEFLLSWQWYKKDSVLRITTENTNTIVYSIWARTARE